MKSRKSQDLARLFFTELKHFNSSNFKAIATADLTKQDAAVHKAFSSVVTRYFIFREKHPDITDAENNMLYYKLKLDLVARYFAEYPETTTDNLIAFQLELKNYIKENKPRDVDMDEYIAPKEDTNVQTMLAV